MTYLRKVLVTLGSILQGKDSKTERKLWNISNPAAPFKYTWIMQDWGVCGSNRSICVIGSVAMACTSSCSFSYLCWKDPERVRNCSPVKNDAISDIVWFELTSFIIFHHLSSSFTVAQQQQQNSSTGTRIQQCWRRKINGQNLRWTLNESLASIQSGACVKTLPPSLTCQSLAKEIRGLDEQSNAPLIPPNPLYLRWHHWVCELMW